MPTERPGGDAGQESSGRAVKLAIAIFAILNLVGCAYNISLRNWGIATMNFGTFLVCLFGFQK